MKKLKRLYYGWVIVIISIFVIATNGIVSYSFGMFLRPVTMAFNWERGALSLALSLSTLLSGGLAIFTGRLSDKIGPRLLVTASGVLIGAGFLSMSQVSSLWQVYLIWALLIGSGSGCAIVPTMSTIPRWFVKKRGIAVGLAATGLGMGAVIAPILSQSLISGYGWRQAYFVLGLIAFIVIIPLAQFMKHSPQRAGLKPYGENETTDKQSPAPAVGGLSFKQAIKTGRFWIFGFAIFCFLFSILLVINHIAPNAIDIGISPAIAASIVSTFGATSIIGRFSMGFISDKIGARRALTICFIMVTATFIWLLFSNEAWMLYVFAVFFGLSYGGQFPLQTLVTAEIFGIRSLGMIMAAIMLLGTLGSAIGVPFGGIIFDVTGSYRLAFITCVVFGMIGIILCLVLLKTKSWREVSEEGLSPSF